MSYKKGLLLSGLRPAWMKEEVKQVCVKDMTRATAAW